MDSLTYTFINTLVHIYVRRRRAELRPSLSTTPNVTLNDARAAKSTTFWIWRFVVKAQQNQPTYIDERSKTENPEILINRAIADYICKIRKIQIFGILQFVV